MRRTNGTASAKLVIYLALILAGCSTAQLPTATPAVAPGETADADPTDESVSSPGTGEPKPSEEPPLTGDSSPTSEALIAASLAAGTIDYPTSLLYRVYAAFASPQLPAEYRSPIIDLHAATFAFAEIEAHEAELPAEINAALAPYLARPDDPASIFNSPPPAQAVSAAFIGQTQPTPTPRRIEWVSRSAAGGKARVWVEKTDSSGALLEMYAAEVDRVWPKVFSLTREPTPDTPDTPRWEVNPDSAIDLYFPDLAVVDPRLSECLHTPMPEGCSELGHHGGYTRPVKPKTDSTASGAVIIDGSVKGPLLTSHIAHELMHTSQFSYDFNEGSWLLDSTATWGAFRTLQLLGMKPDPEYEYLDDLFTTLDRPLRRDEDLNRYASWLYFLSLQIDYGDEVASKIFEDMAAPGAQNAAAVNDQYPFAESFGRFAVSNWDVDTYERYRRGDKQLPAGYQAGSSYVKELGASDDQLPFKTTYLSADYASYTFTDDVRQVVFENTLATEIAECACVPSVWLIAKAGGEWKQPELITGERRKYCFSNADEDLEALDIVIANPDFEGLLPLPADSMPTVRALKDDCTGGHGTVTVSVEKHGTYTSNRNFPVDLDLSHQGTITFDLERDENDPSSLVATHSSMSWTYKMKAVETGGGCAIVETADGGGTWSAADGPTVLLRWSAPDGTLFGMMPNEKKYVLEVTPPTMNLADGDPNGYYQAKSDLCGSIQLGLKFPYSVLAIVDGDLPDNPTSLSGSRQRTLPPMSDLDLPSTETVTWSISLDSP